MSSLMNMQLFFMALLNIMGAFYHVFVLVLLHFSTSSASSLSLSFSPTYIDAESSLLRSVDAESSQSIRGDLSYHREKHGDFYLTVPVGTPPQDLIFLVDTGSEFTWSQCSPCTSCNDTHGAPLFASKDSSSFLAIPCNSPLCSQSSGFTVGCGNASAIGPSCTFNVAYADMSFAEGSVATDSFHLHPDFSSPFVFGCAAIDLESSATSSSGIMGLGPGNFSFTSQLFGRDKLDIPHKFAYCLPDKFANLNGSGTIQFGEYELPANLSYTELVPGPWGDTSLYYVNLEGITVGEVLIKVDMEDDEGEGAGGTIFDSGTDLTYLGENIYKEFVEEVRKQTANFSAFAPESTASKLCYMVPADTKELPPMPLVTLHFAGMVDLELGPASLLYARHRRHNTSTQFCLAFHSTRDIARNFDLNIIGNFQQQNYWVEYNLQTSSLGLAKATNCAQF